jgi:hypothetical protein
MRCQSLDILLSKDADLEWEMVLRIRVPVRRVCPYPAILKVPDTVGDWPLRHPVGIQGYHFAFRLCSHYSAYPYHPGFPHLYPSGLMSLLRGDPSCFVSEEVESPHRFFSTVQGAPDRLLGDSGNHWEYQHPQSYTRASLRVRLSTSMAQLWEGDMRRQAGCREQSLISRWGINLERD